MKVKLLKKHEGFKKGSVIEVTKDLANSMLDSGKAEEIENVKNNTDSDAG